MRFALKAARANAALAGRDLVEDEDMIAAIQLVFDDGALAVLAIDAIHDPAHRVGQAQIHCDRPGMHRHRG